MYSEITVCYAHNFKVHILKFITLGSPSEGILNSYVKRKNKFFLSFPLTFVHNTEEADRCIAHKSSFYILYGHILLKAFCVTSTPPSRIASI